MMKQTRRRSAEEWGRLVAAWDQSGVSASVFAQRRGLSAKTLTWWRWRLSKKDDRRASAAPIALVRAEVIEEPEEDLAWEIRSHAGDTLRVSGEGALSALPLALAALGLASEVE